MLKKVNKCLKLIILFPCLFWLGAVPSQEPESLQFETSDLDEEGQIVLLKDQLLCGFLMRLYYRGKVTTANMVLNLSGLKLVRNKMSLIPIFSKFVSFSLFL